MRGRQRRRDRLVVFGRTDPQTGQTNRWGKLRLFEKNILAKFVTLRLHLALGRVKKKSLMHSLAMKSRRFMHTFEKKEQLCTKKKDIEISLEFFSQNIRILTKDHFTACFADTWPGLDGPQRSHFPPKVPSFFLAHFPFIYILFGRK